MLSHDDDYFDCLHEIIASRNQLPVFLCGDFNARTGDLRTEILHADIVEEQSRPLAALQNENPDDVKNFRGRNLIHVCSAHGLAIVNGLHYNDTVFTGGFTCFPHNGGKSTVDYIICDIESLDQVRSFEIFGSMSHSSDHLPIAVNLRVQVKQAMKRYEGRLRVRRTTIIPYQVVDSLLNDIERGALSNMEPAAAYNIVLENLKAGKVTVNTITKNHVFVNPIAEIRSKRDQCFQIFRDTKKQNPHYSQAAAAFQAVRKEFNERVSAVRRQEEKALWDAIMSARTSNPREFWEKIGFSKNNTHNNEDTMIGIKDIYLKYKQLASSSTSPRQSFRSQPLPFIPVLDDPLSESEVIQAITEIPGSSSCGNLDIPTDVFKRLFFSSVFMHIC